MRAVSLNLLYKWILSLSKEKEGIKFLNTDIWPWSLHRSTLSYTKAHNQGLIIQGHTSIFNVSFPSDGVAQYDVLYVMVS